MSAQKEFSVSEDVVELIDEVIAENGWNPVSGVKYYPGTEVGDGYASKHVAVDISRENAQIVKLFVKYGLDFKSSEEMPIEKFYGNETYFYDVLYPAYRKFLREKNVENVFAQAPKCYGTSTKNVIALENIKEKGFRLFDRKKIMDEKHIVLVLKTFARFHATSYAFKDQDKDGYGKLIENWDGDVFANHKKDSPALVMFLGMIQDGLNRLDPVKDKSILEKCDANVLSDSIMDVMKNVNEYSIFTQGDCWCNNIMFLYENEHTNDDPIDIMLVDWQLLRPTSPVYDVAYFFYTIAAEEALEKTDFYLETYYEELSREMKHLGSDPTILYPRSVFRKEWKEYSKYGFAMAFMLLKFMLANQDEAPKMDGIDFTDLEKLEKIELFTKFDNEGEYLRRLRILAQFMIDNDYI